MIYLDLEKGDLIWSDEFDYQGPPSSAIWIQQEGGHGWGNNEAQFYTKDRNADVSNGNLVITSKKESFGGKFNIFFFFFTDFR